MDRIWTSQRGNAAKGYADCVLTETDEYTDLGVDIGFWSSVGWSGTREVWATTTNTGNQPNITDNDIYGKVTYNTTGDKWLAHGSKRFARIDQDYTVTINVRYRESGSNYYGSASFTVPALEGKIYVKNNDSWKRGSVYVNGSGTWKRAKAIYVKKNGTWSRSK